MASNPMSPGRMRGWVDFIAGIPVATVFKAGVTFLAGLTVKDANLTIQDDGDTTKRAQFQASAISTATTRTYTFPDANGALALADYLPWRHEINPWMVPSGQTNFATRAVFSSALGNGFVNSTGAQNALINWEVALAAGTWAVDLLHATGTDRGIYTVTLGGVAVGTVDGYAAVAANNVMSTLSGIAVATTGHQTLQIQMATKNGASTNFLGVIEWLTLRRTA